MSDDDWKKKLDDAMSSADEFLGRVPSLDNDLNRLNLTGLASGQLTKLSVCAQVAKGSDQEKQYLDTAAKVTDVLRTHGPSNTLKEQSAYEGIQDYFPDFEAPLETFNSRIKKNKDFEIK